MESVDNKTLVKNGTADNPEKPQIIHKSPSQVTQRPKDPGRAKYEPDRHATIIDPQELYLRANNRV